MLIYALILKLRHLMYDKGWLKSVRTEVPSICVGNVGVGGTGKTPMTELIIRTLKEGDVESADSEMFGFEGSLFAKPMYSIAVLSRGYKRKTKGFQQVTVDGTAEQFGDEPLLIKRKFPDVTVVVDENRVRGCDFLSHPEKIVRQKESIVKKIIDPDVRQADIIILDDAFQHRRISATKSIVLTTYSRPFFKDRLLPFGRLRDLRSRVKAADMVVVTKCPPYLDEWEKGKWAQNIGLNLFDIHTCRGTYPNGKQQIVLFATTQYEKLQPVFPEGDPRYTHSKFVVLFSGIANDTPLASWLCETFKLVAHMEYHDHHYFTRSDIRDLYDNAMSHPMALLATTEKDAQRIRTIPDVPQVIRKRLFYAPIRTLLLSSTEQKVFTSFVTE